MRRVINWVSVHWAHLLYIDPQGLCLIRATSLPLCLAWRGEQGQQNLPHTAVRDGNTQEESQRGNQVCLRHYRRLNLWAHRHHQILNETDS